MSTAYDRAMDAARREFFGEPSDQTQVPSLVHLPMFRDEHLSYVATTLAVEVYEAAAYGDPARVGPFIEAMRDGIRLLKEEDDRRHAAG